MSSAIPESNVQSFDSVKKSVFLHPKTQIPYFLILGNPEPEEFRFLWENLNETAKKHFFFAEDPDFRLSEPQSSFILPNTDFYPALVLFLRSWSGEFSSAHVQAVRRRFPLSPLLAVLGSWCEGEARNGCPLPGVHAVSWFDLCAMLPLETFALENGWASVWSLPPETLPEQRFLFEYQREEKQKIFNVKKNSIEDHSDYSTDLPSLNIWIESDDFDQFILLRDFCLRTFSQESSCRILGSWQNDSLPAIEENAENHRKKDKCANIIFFDFPDFSQTTIEKFYAIQKRVPQSLVIAFTEFPRVEEWRFLKKNGARAMFPKPFRLADLAFFCSQQIKKQPFQF